ncbi:MAG: ABC transporter substrate-binding protein [Propionibacteriaceae bacterium]|nr:ABC transporter substrate-binding protein [Propionibacteriaceae bacterium]
MSFNHGLRRLVALVGALLGVSLLLSACTGPTTGTGGSQPVVLNVGATAEPTGLDPATTTGAGTPFVLLYNVYETLVRINDQGEIKPLLARTWTVSPDATVYTFDLEPSATFASGRPVNAQAVVDSLLRTRDGEKTTKVLKGQLEKIKQVTAVGERQVEVTLNAPSQQWLYDMTSTAGIIYDLGADGDLNTAPAGSGPYVFSAHDVGASVTLKRNENYWGTGPRVDEVNFKYYADANAMVTAMLSGQLDVISNLTVPQAVDQFSDTSRFKVSEGTTDGEVVLGFNHANPALQDVRVRQAINHAIDRQAIIDGAWGGKGTLIGSMVPPTDRWYEDLSKTYPHDPEKAKALLAEAGQEGLTLRLRVPNLPYAPPSARLVAAQLREVGIEVVTEELEFATWLDSVYKQRDYDMTIVAHVEPWDLGAFARTDYYWGYDNPEFAELMAKADATTTQDEHTTTLRQAAKLLADDAAADWLFLLPNIIITTTEVSGIEANSTGLSFDLTHVATSR